MMTNLFPYPRYVDIHCTACNACHLDREKGQCVYGSPYGNFNLGFALNHGIEKNCAAAAPPMALTDIVNDR